MQITTRSNLKDQMNKSQYRNTIDSYTILKFISKIIISKFRVFYRNRTKLSLSRCDGTPGRGIQGSLRHCIRDRKVSDHIDFLYIYSVVFLLLTNKMFRTGRSDS